MAERQSVVDWVKEKVVESIKGTGEILDTTVNTVSGSVVNVIKGTGSVGTAVTMVGTLRGAREVGVEALDAVHASGSAAVKTAAEVSGDIGRAARDAVEGAITGARDVGISAEQAAAAAATGALRGAGEIGGTAVEEVRNAVTGVIGGVKIVLREPFRAEAEPARKAS